MLFKKNPRPITEITTLPGPAIELEGKLDDRPSAIIEWTKGGFTGQYGKQISLKESESRYRRLFEAAQDGILILDAETGAITDVNPFLIKMLGYSRDEFVEKKLWEVGAFRDIEASMDAFEALQKKEYIRYEDLPLKTKDGRLVQVEFVSNVYLVGGEKVIQCNIRDITERKRAEARIKTANDELLVLVKELQWRDRELQLLNQMNDLLQSCMTQAEAYKVITLMMGELFPAQNGCLAILHNRGQELETVACWGPDAIMKSAFSLKDCWALRRGQLHEVLNPQAGLVCGHFIHPPQVGYLCLPLMVQGETLGVLSLIDSVTRKDVHQDSLQQLAMTVGESIKLCLSNLKLRDELRHQAIHDPLTGLFNRRYLDETLPRELNRALRLNAPLCVVMLDIDGFKQFNDSFGHGSGDSLLREFGSVLRKHLRNSDISCRYGGDEFFLVMPDSAVEDTRQRVEEIRTFLKEIQQLHYSGQELDIITLSAGIAFMPDHGTTESQLLQAADDAMYTAKQAGRDRIVVYQPSPSL